MGLDRRRRVAAWLTAGALIATAGAATASVQTDLETLQGESYADGYAPLVRAVMPAVVAVRVQPGGAEDADGTEEFFERFFGDGPNAPNERDEPAVGVGSGFIVSGDGLAVTNAHVVRGAGAVEVQLADGRILQATVRGVDLLTDLALLEVDSDEDLPFVTFGDSSSVEVGDRVLAIGNPFGLGSTVTSGIVSALGRDIGSGPFDDFLQVDAPINRGNSGGPTFDLEGNVIGVNTAIFSPSGGNVGIGFAIAADLAREVIDDLEDDGRVSRGWLGIEVQGLDEALAEHFELADRDGVLVAKVEPNGPAADAGLRTGDVVRSVDGEAVADVRSLIRRIAALGPSHDATLGIVRDGEELVLDVRLGERPEPRELAAAVPAQEETAPRLGLALAPLDQAARQTLGLAPDEGVAIAAVMPESPAAEAGVEANDIILEIGNVEVGTPEEAQTAVRDQLDAGEESVLLLLNRNGSQRFAVLPVELS